MASVSREAAVTAMCLYEHYVEAPERPFSQAVESYRTDNGSFDMREKVLTLGKKIEDAFSSLYDALNAVHGVDLSEHLHEGDFMTWDFDTIPHLADEFGPRFMRSGGVVHHREIVEELLRMAKLEQYSGIATFEPL